MYKRQARFHPKENCIFLALLCSYPFARYHKTVSYTHLAKLDKQAEEQLALTIRQMQEAEGVTEALKAPDQLEWVRRMNSIRNRAEEIINTELIFV